MKQNIHLLLLGITSAAALALASPANAEGILAGTSIENTAQATYSIGGTTQTVPSNTVTVTVSEILNVAVSSLDGSSVTLTGDGAVLTYQINNTGNGPEIYELTVDPAISGDDFDPAITLLAYDSNGNGVYDDSVDTVISLGSSTPEIPADSSIRIFVLTKFDSPLPNDGATADVRLVAVAQTGSGTPGTVFLGQGAGGADAVVGATTAQDNAIGTLIAELSAVTLVKTATILDPFGGGSPVPGAIVTYSLVATVTGSTSINDLVVNDPIPANTTYEGNSLTLEGAALTDASDADTGEADGATVTVRLGTVSSGGSRTITFKVKIEE